MIVRIPQEQNKSERPRKPITKPLRFYWFKPTPPSPSSRSSRFVPPFPRVGDLYLYPSVDQDISCRIHDVLGIGPKRLVEQVQSFVNKDRVKLYPTRLRPTGLTPLVKGVVHRPIVVSWGRFGVLSSTSAKDELRTRKRTNFSVDTKIGYTREVFPKESMCCKGSGDLYHRSLLGLRTTVAPGPVVR